MSNKELLFKALRNEATERTPWVPFVGVHGGSLIGADAEQYLQDADKIVAGLEKAVDLYKPDGIPIVFDLQLEAEILGCDIVWAKETPPAVSTHPLDDDYDIADLPEFSIEKGRIPMVLDAVRGCKSSFGENVGLYGLLTGPLTLAIHLRGDDFLMDMFDEEDEVYELLDYCCDIAKQMSDAYIAAGVDIIGVVDPMISQISPEHFTGSIAPVLNKLFDYIRDKGKLSSLFVCGNATRNIPAMCDTTCDNISIDENVNMAELAKEARAKGKSFGGNIQLTVVLLLGDENDARRDAVRCLDQAGEGTGYILAPGCDLPYATDPKNLIAISEVVHDPYKLDVARKIPAKDMNDSFDDILIPEYPKEDKVIVDVITLDSKGCAPCAYMLKAAEEAAKAYGLPADVREHKITGRDGLGYMTKLGATAIPSLCIDGKEQFASIIPDRSELVSRLESAASSKTVAS